MTVKNEQSHTTESNKIVQGSWQATGIKVAKTIAKFICPAFIVGLACNKSGEWKNAYQASKVQEYVGGHKGELISLVGGAAFTVVIPKYDLHNKCVDGFVSKVSGCDSSDIKAYWE